MKSTQKVTRIKLKINPHNDYVLLGLVSSEPDYKLSLSLNNKFKISLKNISPVILSGDNNSEPAFSRFSNNDSAEDMVFNLVSNRSGKNFLLKKLRNIDFLFQIHSENEININNITSILREIDIVTAVFNIDINTLKDKNLQYLTQ